MASRCRACHLSVPFRGDIHLPNPEQLVLLLPFMDDLVDAVAEFESFGAGTPGEAIRWVEFEVRHAAGLDVPRRHATRGER